MVRAGNNNTIENNTFFNNKDCTIFGTYTNNNMILSNTIDNPPAAYYFPNGIFLLDSIENNISVNIIKNCDSGVELGYASDYNIILNNVIGGCEYDGIRITGGSSYNKIIENNISYNLYWGIEIQEGNDNIIYHNNFEYNMWSAIDGGNNIWDDGKYGNYWSDYKDKYPNAKKKPQEGIWDTPYEIDGGSNKDNRPLIKPWPKSKSKSKTMDSEEDCIECKSDDRPICNILNNSITYLINKLVYYLGKINQATTDLEELYYLILFGNYYAYAEFLYQIYMDVLKCDNLEINLIRELPALNPLLQRLTT